MTTPQSPARCISKSRALVFPGAFIILGKSQIWFLWNQHFSLTSSVSNLVTEGKFSPSSHNYFLTLSRLFQLVNYVELFSLLFSKNASSEQCKNIYYLLSLYLLTFFFSGEKRKWISCELSWLSTQPAAIHGLSRCCLILNPFILKLNKFTCHASRFEAIYSYSFLHRFHWALTCCRSHQEVLSASVWLLNVY